ncbi:MAG: TonB-dependent receptor plug domain-containing protein [Leptolyngbya sp. SIO4C5]|nr:TonB-dependent receptor plug domain-containing protein [Leptolyngbya sp. SIO4C5]
MEKWLSGLSLLTLLILASGQGAFAQALTEPLAPEPDTIDEPDTEANVQDAISSELDNAVQTDPKAEEQEAIAEPLPARIAAEPEPTSETDNPEVVVISPVSLPIHPSTHPPTYPSTPPPATTVTDWLAQIEASLVQITNVRVEDTETGLQVILETANGELAAPTTTVSGNALIAEIPNAVLALPNADEFQQFDPAAGIALVSVTPLPNDQVRIAITGTDAPPAVDLSSAATGLTLSATPGDPTAQAPDDETIQIGVTGEQAGYAVDSATTGTRTDTPLLDIPQSIQVIPQEVLEDQQVIRLNDALRNVSGVVAGSQDPRGGQFIVRGFDFSSILRDGFRTVGNGGFPELANIERIEVLKGPASILFGSLEPGGVINLVSEQPLSEPFYEGGLRLGNRGLIEPSLDLTGPITEDGRLRYRLNALVRREDSSRDFDTPIIPILQGEATDARKELSH